MSWTEKEIFADDAIVEPRVLVSEHTFTLKGIPQEVRARVYRYLDPPHSSDPFYFTTTHAIHTPEQIGPYYPSAPWASDPEYALHRAVDSLVSYYRSAVERGHSPSESWLVVNDYF